MKDGLKNNKKKPIKQKRKQQKKTEQPRIYEFIQSVNGSFSNKRLLAIVYAVASILYAFIGDDPYVVGIFAAASTGSSFGGVFEKREHYGDAY